jgi:hypothetical protein
LMLLCLHWLNFVRMYHSWLPYISFFLKGIFPFIFVIVKNAYHMFSNLILLFLNCCQSNWYLTCTSLAEAIPPAFSLLQHFFFVKIRITLKKKSFKMNPTPSKNLWSTMHCNGVLMRCNILCPSCLVPSTIGFLHAHNEPCFLIFGMILEITITQ